MQIMYRFVFDIHCHLYCFVFMPKAATGCLLVPPQSVTPPPPLFPSPQTVRLVTPPPPLTPPPIPTPHAAGAAAAATGV